MAGEAAISSYLAGMEKKNAVNGKNATYQKVSSVAEVNQERKAELTKNLKDAQSSGASPAVIEEIERARDSVYDTRTHGGSSSSGSSRPSGGGSTTVRQPSAEELRLEQRRQDMQKSILEGSTFNPQDPQYSGLSHEDYNKVVVMEYFLLQYQNDPYVANNIKNEIAAVKGDPQTNMPKTTKITFESNYTYDKAAIVGKHQLTQSILLGGNMLGQFAKGPWTVFSALASLSYELEQNDSEGAISSTVGALIESSDNIIPAIYPNLQKALSKAGKAFMLIGVVDDVMSIINEDRDTYIENGFEIRPGDSFVDVTLKSNLGDEIRSAQFYFRGDSLEYVIDTGVMDAIGPGEARFGGMQSNINRKWREAGYVGR